MGLLTNWIDRLYFGIGDFLPWAIGVLNPALVDVLKDRKDLFQRGHPAVKREKREEEKGGRKERKRALGPTIFVVPIRASPELLATQPAGNLLCLGIPTYKYTLTKGSPIGLRRSGRRYIWSTWAI